MHSFPGCTALTSTRRVDDTVTHSHLPRLAAECPFINLAKIAPRYSRKIPCNHISPPARPFRGPISPFTNSYPMRLMSCSILSFGSGFVIKSAGFTLVPTFFATNLPDLDASCIHRFCMSTCFALPNLLRLTKHIIAEASRCRFSPHNMPRSFATLRIPSPSDAVLTAAYSSLSAEDSDTTCCFLVHTLRQCPLLMMTPPETDLRVALSPPQSASEHASSSPTLLPAEPALCSRSGEVSSDHLDTFRVTHCGVGHRTAYPHCCELEVWAVL